MTLPLRKHVQRNRNRSANLCGRGPAAMLCLLLGGSGGRISGRLTDALSRDTVRAGSPHLRSSAVTLYRAKYWPRVGLTRLLY